MELALRSVVALRGMVALGIDARFGMATPYARTDTKHRSS